MQQTEGGHEIFAIPPHKQVRSTAPPLEPWRVAGLLGYTETQLRSMALPVFWPQGSRTLAVCKSCPLECSLLESGASMPEVQLCLRRHHVDGP